MSRFPGRKSEAKATSLTVLALAVLAVVGVGVAVALRQMAALDRAGAADVLNQAWGRAAENQPDTMIPTLVGELPDVAWDLAYSAATDEVWFVLGTGESAGLYRADQKGFVLATPLPGGEYSGVHHRVRFLASGDVILNADYALVRYSPSSGKTTEILLAADAVGALSNAFDPAIPLPGTWVSAFAVDGNDIILARNNVTVLTVFDGLTMQPRIAIPLPEDYAGSRQVITADDQLYLLNRAGTIGHFNKSGQLVEEFDVQASEMAVESGQLLTSGAVAGPVRDVTGQPFQSDLNVGRDGLLVTESGAIATYDQQTGTIEVWSSSAPAVRRMTLPYVPVPNRGPGYRSGATVPPTLLDLAISDTGAIWLSRGDSRTLWVILP
jgi:hypothetical protein